MAPRSFYKGAMVHGPIYGRFILVPSPDVDWMNFYLYFAMMTPRAPDVEYTPIKSYLLGSIPKWRLDYFLCVFCKVDPGGPWGFGGE